jgi:CubicO group peptidase (beta-lactamase class C family)
MMLDHSVGVPVCRTPVKPGGAYDWDYMVELLADEQPFWKPGVRNGYHMINFGWTVGEIVRRVSGRSLGTFFREEIADPLGIDFWIGMPEEHEPRVAPMIPFMPTPEEPLGAFVLALLGDPQSIQALSLLNVGGFDPNSRAAHAAEVGGGGGISNARGLAGMYTPLANGGAQGDVKLVDERQLARMGEVSMATHEDATLLIPTRFALGFMKSMDNRKRASGDRDSAILSSAAFGHVGAGGSIGFADPAEGLAFGYSMNRMGNGIMLNPRGQALVDATYRALGYASNDSGVWARALNVQGSTATSDGAWA